MIKNLTEADLNNKHKQYVCDQVYPGNDQQDVLVGPVVGRVYTISDWDMTTWACPCVFVTSVTGGYVNRISQREFKRCFSVALSTPSRRRAQIATAKKGINIMSKQQAASKKPSPQKEPRFYAANVDDADLNIIYIAVRTSLEDAVKDLKKAVTRLLPENPGLEAYVIGPFKLGEDLIFGNGRAGELKVTKKTVEVMEFVPKK